MQFRAILRRTGGSLALTVPADIARVYRLRVGDAVVWNIGEDETKVQFFRVTTNDEPAEQEQEAAK
jgi:antitoxin component of MazEF toxin-antitoxin module